MLEVEGERITAVTTGIDRPPAGAGRLAGLTLPGLVNAHSHAFHRALRSRTQAGRGSFWTWRDQMYRLAAALTPDCVPAPGDGDVRRDGAGGHHDGGRVPLPAPRRRRHPVRRAQRHGRGAHRGRGGGRHPPDPARHLLPPRRHRAAAQRRPAPFLRRHREGMGRAGRGAGAVDHRAHRCRGALRAGGSAGRDGRRGRLGLRAPLASPCPRQRAAGGERGLSGRLRPYPGRAAARRRLSWTIGSPPFTPRI